MHPITGISFSSGDVNSSPFGALSIYLEYTVATLSCIKEIGDPESTSISTSFWSKNPRVSAALDLTAATTTLPTAEGLTASWGTPSPSGAPQCRFPNSNL